jgi:hypothetical protein
MRQLHGRAAHAAGRGVNQDRLGARQVARCKQRFARSEERFRNGRGLLEGKPVGNLHRQRFRHHHALGVSAASEQHHHSIANAHAARTARAECAHHARALQAQDVGRARRRWVQAASL